ncbi:MAG: 50S ribosomal protein L29 [Chloroflexi bacterium]|nr:50S ribosomal protein L29 [Chloroflexota bacterium]
MEIAEVRAFSDADLVSQIEESERSLMNLRFRAATMQLANVNEIKKAKKRIARLRTVVRERELARAATE